MGLIVATAMAGGAAGSAAGQITKELASQLGAHQPRLVLAFASTQQPLGDVLPTVGRAFPGAVVLGVSTAGEFTERGDRKGHVAALAISGDVGVAAGMGGNLAKDPEGAVRAAAAALPPPDPKRHHRTALLLLDPLAGVSEEVTLLASAILGDNVQLAGGAAGDDLKMASTFVALGARVASDAVVLAVLDTSVPLGLGVHHGHAPLSQPYTVTRAAGATVETINNRPAWDVWVEATQEDARGRGMDPNTLKPDQVTPFLLLYEAGLDTGEGALKIRAPLSKRPDGAISFACGIPQGATIRITRSAEAAQVDSARAAAAMAKKALKGQPASGALVFDCICRNLILQDKFATAVDAIHRELGSVPVAGFETYGEVALNAGDMSGFHNTTTVVLAFPR